MPPTSLPKEARRGQTDDSNISSYLHDKTTSPLGLYGYHALTAAALPTLNYRETRRARLPSGQDHTMQPVTLSRGIRRVTSLPLVRLALRPLGATPPRAASARPGSGAIYSIAHLSTRELAPPVRLVLETSGFDSDAVLI